MNYLYCESEYLETLNIIRWPKFYSKSILKLRIIKTIQILFSVSSFNTFNYFILYFLD